MRTSILRTGKDLHRVRIGLPSGTESRSLLGALVGLTAVALVVGAALATAAVAAGAQAPDAATLRAQIRGYRRAHDVDILRELTDLLSIPNLASDSANIRKNADHLLGMLGRRGFATRLLESPGSPPAVYGEMRVPGATKTVVLYAHYDGQPVTPSQWASPPWTPTLRDKPLEAGGKVLPSPTAAGSVDGAWRLYARAAADDKAPIVEMLAAMDALRSVGVRPSMNVKIFLEGEEEAGSPHIEEMLRRHAGLLASDLWLFGDGPVHQSRRQEVVFGARGVVSLELTTFGPIKALHSGHYGNWAPNPIVEMANLIASMRDDDGHIRIAHYYDDVTPIGPAERAALASIPPVDSALRAELQLGGTEANDAPLMERILLPALNLRGFQGGAVGAAAANAVPVDAHASIDFRLVPNETPAHVRDLVEEHARARGFHVVHAEPTRADRTSYRKLLRLEWQPGGYRAVKMSMDSPVAHAVIHAVATSLDTPIVVVPMLGGSLPLYAFEDVLKTPLVGLPTVNHDDNQHAANENLRLQNLWDGIEVYGGVLARLGRELEGAPRYSSPDALSHSRNR